MLQFARECRRVLRDAYAMMIFIPVRRLRSNCGGVTSWASRVKGAFRFHNLDDVSPSTVARVGREGAWPFCRERWRRNGKKMER